MSNPQPPSLTDRPASGGLNRAIGRLALPAIVSNITVPLLGLSDTTISGHLGNEAAIGAIAVGSMMTNVAYWLCGFLRMGTTGLAAEAYGAADRDRQMMTLWRAVSVALCIGCLLTLLQAPLCALLLEITGATPDVRGMAGQYYTICIWGAPAMLVTMALTGWMIGMQCTVYPMAVAIITNLINIGASVVCVFPLRMGFPGVALGTLISQWCGVALSVYFATRLGARWSPLWRKGAGERWRSITRGDGLGKFFKVNSDLFFRSFCIMSVSMSVTSIGARLGTVTLAGNAVIVQFFIFYSYFMDGFAFAGEALTGKAKGASDVGAIRRVIRRLLWWCGGIAGAFTLIYAFAGSPIVDFITDEESVRRQVEAYRWVVVLLPCVSVAAFITDGFYIGMTSTRPLLWATLAGATLFFAISLLPTLAHPLSNTLLWTGFLTYLVTRGGILLLHLPSLLRPLATATAK